MKEFLGIDGYARPAEGYFSWQHLVFVTSLIMIMIALAVFLGKKYRNTDEATRNRVLIFSAILMDAIEIFKLVIFCIRSGEATAIFYNLPLFLCSIQLIALPLAAFSHGRVREAALDFVFIFGVLGAVLGTYAAGNNYSCYPVLSLDNVASGLTHTISGFASLYIAISGLASMKKKNIGFTFGILLAFCVMAYIANIFTDSNYMFLSRGDGTPYDLLFNLVGGNQIIYPIGVLVLFLLYIIVYYQIYYFATRKRAQE